MDYYVFFFSSRRRHTRYWRDWSSDVCSSDLVDGMVIMYADNITDSIKSALAETERRRKKQIQYTEKYKITPRSVVNAIPDKATTKSDIDFKTLTKSIARSDLLKLSIETEATMKFGRASCRERV